MSGQGENPAKRRCVELIPEKFDCLGETGFETKTFSFLWTIRNYSFLNQMTYFQSPIFDGGSKNSHKWQMLCSPKNEIDGVEYFVLYLRLDNSDHSISTKDEVVTAMIQIHVLNEDGEKFKTARTNSPHKFKRYESIYGTFKLIPSTDIMDPSNKVLVGNTIKVACDISMRQISQKSINQANDKCNPMAEEWNNRKLHEMAIQLGNIFNESNGTDITVVTGETSFKAHKAILMARSTVFAAMFEKQSNILEIPDCEATVVKGMLEHLYTGQTDAMAVFAADLLHIAEKYELHVLKDDCQRSIAKKLTFDNAAAILLLADTHNAAILKQRAIDFINVNKEVLRKREDFQKSMKTYSSIDSALELYFSQSE